MHGVDDALDGGSSALVGVVLTGNDPWLHVIGMDDPLAWVVRMLATALVRSVITSLVRRRLTRRRQRPRAD